MLATQTLILKKAKNMKIQASTTKHSSTFALSALGVQVDGELPSGCLAKANRTRLPT